MEDLSQSVLETTKVTVISLKLRFSFGCADERMLEIFTDTNEGVAVHPAYLPCRHTLSIGCAESAYAIRKPRGSSSF